MTLARFNKQVIRPDFQAFGQVDRKFNNSPVYVGLRQTTNKSQIEQNPELDKIPNGQDPELDKKS